MFAMPADLAAELDAEVAQIVSSTRTAAREAGPEFQDFADINEAHALREILTALAALQ
ncbi:hypothetical protein [Nannocystis pusilla]|uniref:hypothetical protein n=1 Tax=Nannocystis pusilla TaxID=889268 RepID=UPI003BF0B832